MIGVGVIGQEHIRTHYELGCLHRRCRRSAGREYISDRSGRRIVEEGQEEIRHYPVIGKVERRISNRRRHRGFGVQQANDLALLGRRKPILLALHQVQELVDGRR
jgi:hypothetical protein